MPGDHAKSTDPRRCAHHPTTFGATEDEPVAAVVAGIPIDLTPRAIRTDQARRDRPGQLSIRNQGLHCAAGDEQLAQEAELSVELSGADRCRGGLWPSPGTARFPGHGAAGALQRSAQLAVAAA